MSDDAGGEVDDNPENLPLERIPGYLIRRAQQVHNALWSANVPDEVTGPQYAVLATLAVRPATQQRRLGELASIDKSSVAEVVGRLVARNWISKMRDTLDARSSLLSLVDEANVALGRLTPAARAVQEQFLAPLPPDERARFVGWLGRISRFAPDSVDAHVGSAAPALDLNVPGHLIRCAQQIHTAIWVRTFGDELTGPQYAILHILATRPDISQRELGELAALDRSTVAELVERLHRKGWLHSSRDPDDGRAKVIRLADSAAKSMSRLTAGMQAVQRELIAPLPPENRDQFIEQLAIVAFVGAISDGR